MNPGISGILEDWGIDFMSEDYNKSICGEIYNSTGFEKGRLVYTSRIDNIFIQTNYLSNDFDINSFLIVKTLNNSHYILGKISNQFNNYLNFLIDKNKLCKKSYSSETNQGIINCINFYLKQLEDLNEKKLD